MGVELDDIDATELTEGVTGPAGEPVYEPRPTLNECCEGWEEGRFMVIGERG